MDALALVLLVAGLALGFLLARIFLRNRVASELAVLRNQLEERDSRLRELEEKGQSITQELLRTREALSEETRQRALLQGENRMIDQLQTELDLRADQVRDLEEKRTDLSARAAKAEAEARRVPMLQDLLEKSDESIRELREEVARLTEQVHSRDERIALYEQDEERIRNAFANLSSEALEKNAQAFLSLARENLEKYQQSARGDLEKRQQAIDDLIKPFHDRLRDFGEKVERVYSDEAKERSTLRGEIMRLMDLNRQISKEASNLALALKGDTKKQGNWGELICEKILEYSGLRKGDEYKLQVSMQDADGKRLQPDIIVYLPDGKHIIIDSKVSLVAYDRYVAAETEEERTAAEYEHIGSVKRHIRELSEKKYPSLPDLDTPDFTLLFMPIESSFGLALQVDNELFSYAWDRKIVIVSPSTLLATLRTISSLWKQERQTRNALDIADRAGKLYDKFVGFVDDLVTVGKKLGDVKQGYDEAMKKLSSGPGNLVRQSEILREMGAKATKQLPQAIVDRSNELPVAAGPAANEPVATAPDPAPSHGISDAAGPLFAS